MISQDDAARTAERLADALTAAAEVMAESDAAAGMTPVPQRPGRLERARGWLIPIAAAASVIAVIAIVAASVLLVGHLDGTPSSVGQPTSPTAASCQPIPTSGSTTAPPRFYVTTDVGARQIQLQVRRTSDCTVTAVVSLPAGWVLSGGISAAADDRTFFAAAFSARCPSQPSGSISSAAHTTRFFRFTVNDQGRAGRLTMVGPAVTGLVGSIAASPDGSRIAFNAADANYAGPGTGCSGGEAEGAAISVVDLATGKIRTWETLDMPPAPAGTSVTPHDVSWLADGHTLAVSYVWPTSNTSAQLSIAVVALDTNSNGGSLLAHSHLLWSQQRKCTLCVQEALISPDGKSLTAVATQQTAGGYPIALLQISLPSGRSRVLYESAAQSNPSPAFIQDGSGQHAILLSGTQAGWVRAGKLLLMQVPDSAVSLSGAITTVAW